LALFKHIRREWTVTNPSLAEGCLPEVMAFLGEKAADAGLQDITGA